MTVCQVLSGLLSRSPYLFAASALQNAVQVRFEYPGNPYLWPRLCILVLEKWFRKTLPEEPQAIVFELPTEEKQIIFTDGVPKQDD